MAKVYLLLGSNIGDRQFFIDSAVQMVQALAGTVVEKSSVYETMPWGFEADNLFYNQVVAVETLLSAAELFQVIVSIENQLGRTRDALKYSSRTIDIDILFYENDVIFSEELTIPHPRIGERRFVLQPMYELNPCFLHPSEKKTIGEMLCECSDPLEVKRIENQSPYLSPNAKSPASPMPGTI